MQAGELNWRETYYIFFPAERRPKLQDLTRALDQLSDRIVLQNAEADEEGKFESILIEAPDDHAALEISYEDGDGVVEQSVQLGDQFKEDLDEKQLLELMSADARMDIMHFEHIREGEEFAEDDEDEILDPGCLLLVVGALAELTNGLPIDPASGAVLL